MKAYSELTEREQMIVLGIITTVVTVVLVVGSLTGLWHPLCLSPVGGGTCA